MSEENTEWFDRQKQREEQSDHGLRSDFPRSGGASPAMSAAGEHIEKRNHGPSFNFAIKNTVRYTDRKSRAETSAGTRPGEGQSPALLKHGEEIPGVPIAEASAQRQKRAVVGDAVTVTPPGSPGRLPEEEQDRRRYEVQAEAAEKLQARTAEQERRQEQTAQRVAKQMTHLLPVITPATYMQTKGVELQAGVFTDKEGGEIYIPANRYRRQAMDDAVHPGGRQQALCDCRRLRFR